MKFVIREHQADAFKEIVEALKVIAKVDSEEATDAIIGLYKVARILGVEKDLDRIANAKEQEDDYGNWTDMFCLRTVLRSINNVRVRSGRRCGEM